MTIRRKKYGRGHAYYDERPGRAPVKLPGVTTIIREAMAPSRGLRRWPGKVTARYAVDYWDELAGLLPTARLDRLEAAQDEASRSAKAKGGDIHRLAEQIIAGDEVEVPEALAGYADSYVDFLDRYGVKTVAAELVVGSRKERYCGTLDVIGDLPEVTCEGERIPAGRWLLDLKSGASGIWPETALQTCAYSRAEVYLGSDGAEHPVSELGVDRCGAVHVRADGWDLVPLATGEPVWQFFRRLAWLYHHAEAKDGWVGAAAEPPPPAADRRVPYREAWTDLALAEVQGAT